MVTASFYVPLDAHRALAARDTKENRQQFTPQEFETVYLPGLSATELTDVVNLAKNVFDAQQAVAEPTSGTITLRASHSGRSMRSTPPCASCSTGGARCCWRCA
jgi:general secretion pathway protein D